MEISKELGENDKLVILIPNEDGGNELKTRKNTVVETFRFRFQNNNED
jgi:hypothetical protein